MPQKTFFLRLFSGSQRSFQKSYPAKRGTRPPVQSGSSTPKSWKELLIAPLVVSTIGAFAVQQISAAYGKQQQIIAQQQATEKFLAYFRAEAGMPQQRYAALASLVRLGNADLAADLIVALPIRYREIEKKPSVDIHNREQKGTPTPTFIESDIEPETQALEVASGESDGTLTEDEQAFVTFLRLHGEDILPRLCALATDATEGRSRTIENSTAAGALVISAKDGLSRLERIAFDAIPTTKLSGFALALPRSLPSWLKPMEIDEAARKRREGALRIFERRLISIRRRRGALNPVWVQKDILDKYQYLRPRLAAAALSPSDDYTEEARASALAVLGLLDWSQTDPSPSLPTYRELASDRSKPLRTRFLAIDLLMNPQNFIPDVQQQLGKLLIFASPEEQAYWDDLFEGNENIPQAQFFKSVVHETLRQTPSRSDLLHYSQLFADDPKILSAAFATANDDKTKIDVINATRYGNKFTLFSAMVQKFTTDQSPAVRREAFDALLWAANGSYHEKMFMRCVTDIDVRVIEACTRYLSTRKDCQAIQVSGHEVASKSTDVRTRAIVGSLFAEQARACFQRREQARHR